MKIKQIIKKIFPKKVIIREIFGIKYTSIRYLFLPYSLGSLERQYELGVINSIKYCYNSMKKQSIEVVQIGGGSGITSVIHAKNGSIDVHLTIIEPSQSQIKKIKQTLKLNNINNFRVIEKYLGDNRAWNSNLTAEQLPIGQLPLCDILEIDCEGSEKLILENLRIKPNYIILEIHHTIIMENNEWIYSFASSNNYDVQIYSGHNGVLLTNYEFEELSKKILFSKNMTASKFGARGPLIVLLIKKTG